MLEAAIVTLIYIAVAALVVYLVLFVLGQIGIVLPPKAVQIIWLIFALIAILLLVRLVLGMSSAPLLP